MEFNGIQSKSTHTIVILRVDLGTSLYLLTLLKKYAKQNTEDC